jgi:putative hydrolase of the HAD superfamily
VKPKLLIFDLDDTLYPPSNGMFKEIGNRIEAYMREVMKMPTEQVPAIRNDYFKRYGTTLRGLEIEYGIGKQDYLAYVHNVPLRQYISRNEPLKRLLDTLPFPKVILTNSDQAHSKRVLDILEIQDCFSQIIDIIALSPYCKPEEQAFEKAITLLGNPDPHDCVLFEDSPVNIQAAKKFGFTTVQVGREEASSESHYRVHDICKIDGLFDESYSLRQELMV